MKQCKTHKERHSESIRKKSVRVMRDTDTGFELRERKKHRERERVRERGGGCGDKHKKEKKKNAKCERGVRGCVVWVCVLLLQERL